MEPSVVEHEVVADLVHEGDVDARAQGVEVGAVLLQDVLLERDPIGTLPEAVDPARGQRMPSVQPEEPRSLPIG